MVTSASGVQSQNSAISPTAPQPTSTAPVTSFAQQLAAELEDRLGKSRNGARVEIDIQPSAGQNSDGRQFVVTVKDPNGETAKAEGDPLSGFFGPFGFVGGNQYNPSATGSAPGAETEEPYTGWVPPSEPQMQVVQAAGMSETSLRPTMDSLVASDMQAYLNAPEEVRQMSGLTMPQYEETARMYARLYPGSPDAANLEANIAKYAEYYARFLNAPVS